MYVSFIFLNPTVKSTNRLLEDTNEKILPPRSMPGLRRKYEKRKYIRT
jgi:hypothetical protein